MWSCTIMCFWPKAAFLTAVALNVSRTCLLLYWITVTSPGTHNYTIKAINMAIHFFASFLSSFFHPVTRRVFQCIDCHFVPGSHWFGLPSLNSYSFMWLPKSFPFLASVTEHVFPEKEVKKLKKKGGGILWSEPSLLLL